MEDLFVTHNFAGSNLFSQAWRKIILWLGHATQPIFQLQLFPAKILKQLRCFLEEKPTLFLSVFDVKLKFSDERLQQRRKEHTKMKGRGNRQTLCDFQYLFYRQKYLKASIVFHWFGYSSTYFNSLPTGIIHLLFQPYCVELEKQVRTSFQRPENQKIFHVLLLAVTANSMCHSTPKTSVQNLQK